MSMHALHSPVTTTLHLDSTMASSEKEGTPLHCDYTFSFMRRGKAAAPAGKQGEEGAASSPTEGATATGKTTELKTDNDNKDTSAASTAQSAAPNPYENSIKVITTVSTVEGFWETYDFLRRPNDLPTTTDYHFFRGGIKPTWEDPSNAKGGKWIVRLPKGLASRYWEEIILALIGGQFSGVPDGEICGAVLSVRYSEDILGVWNKSANERELVERIRDAIKKILQLPPQAHMEYKPHQASMSDRSSFRNTQVWKSKRLDDGRGTQVERTRRSGSWGEEREERKPRGAGRAWR